MHLPLRLLRLLCAVACLLAMPAFAIGQAYTSIVVFGDSLSDTGNLANLTQAKYGITLRVPGPAANYADGRTTDGLATLPPARNYTGVWVEQLAAGFAAHPPIVDSLDGGTNYAYAYAATGTGTSVYTYGPGNIFSVPVDNMLQQVVDYLATAPVVSNRTLYVVWGGANSLLNATSTSDITNAAIQDVAVIQALINAGATDFLVPNLPPLGAVPRFNGSVATSTPPTQSAIGFNQALAAGLAALPAMNPGKTLHLYPLNIFALFSSIVGPPTGGGLANVTASAQGNALINPDTYLFWDDLHPTTAGHHLIAQAAASLLSPTPITTVTTVTTSPQNSNLNSSITFTATVAPGSGTATPTGTITFLDGTTVLGMSSVVTGTGSTGTATYATSALTAGPHTITASFVGVNGFANSTSVAYTQTVTPPSATSALTPASITITRGATGTTSVAVTPLGGYTGTASFACGVLPAHLTCSFAPTTLTFTGTAAAQSTTLTINTKDMTSLNRPGQGTSPFASGRAPMLAWLAFPFTGLLLMAARRRTAAMRILCFCLLGLLLGAGGCASSNNTASSGTYNIPVSVIAGTSSTNLNLTVVVQ